MRARGDGATHRYVPAQVDRFNARQCDDDGNEEEHVEVGEVEQSQASAFGACHETHVPLTRFSLQMANVITLGVVVGAVTLTALAAAQLRKSRQHTLASSRRRSMDDEVHAARLAVIGEITASIAHELTQPLSAILNNAEAADMLIDAPNIDTQEIKSSLADIRRDTLRASQVISHLRTLLTKRALQLECIDVNHIVDCVLGLIQADAKRRSVKVRCGLQPALPQIAGDPVHLQHVLLNLALNAMDAMDGSSPEERVLEVQTQFGGADWILVQVKDAGPGIAPSLSRQIFDPFFTTKRHGMGLGLSISRHIVEAHGGSIWAENARSGGAVFSFKVPARPVQ